MKYIGFILAIVIAMSAILYNALSLYALASEGIAFASGYFISLFIAFLGGGWLLNKRTITINVASICLIFAGLTTFFNAYNDTARKQTDRTLEIVKNSKSSIEQKKALAEDKDNKLSALMLEFSHIQELEFSNPVFKKINEDISALSNNPCGDVIITSPIDELKRCYNIFTQRIVSADKLLADEEIYFNTREVYLRDKYSSLIHQYNVSEPDQIRGMKSGLETGLVKTKSISIRLVESLKRYSLAQQSYYDFMLKNKNNFQQQNNNIIFSNQKLVDEYNAIISETDAAANEHDAIQNEGTADAKKKSDLYKTNPP